MKNFWGIGTLKRNWIINNTKHFSNLSKIHKKNYYSDLIDSYKYNIKKRGMLWKKLLETKELLMPLFPILSRWKTKKYSTKKEIAETFNSYFVDIGPNLAASIHFRKQNDIPKLYSLRRSLPQYHQPYRLRTGKCICKRQNKQKFRVWWYICRCYQKSVRWNICCSETCFQYLFREGSLPR